MNAIAIKDKDKNTIILSRIQMAPSEEWQTIGKRWCYDITLTYTCLTVNNFGRFLGQYCEVWLREKMLYGKIEEVHYSNHQVSTIIRDVSTTYIRADFETLLNTTFPMRIIQYHE